MDKVVTNQNLQNLTIKIVEHNFINNPALAKLIGTFKPNFNCKITINNRLRTTGGQTYETFNGQFCIQISSLIADYFPKIILVDVIKHELCHYFLMAYHVKNKKGNLVRPHGKEFKALLKSVHGVYTVAYIFKDYNPKHIIYVFQCQKCGNYLCYSYKTANHNYVCNCGGSLTLVGRTSAENYLKNFLHCQYTKPSNNFKKINQHLIKTLNQQKIA